MEKTLCRAYLQIKCLTLPAINRAQCGLWPTAKYGETLILYRLSININFNALQIGFDRKWYGMIWSDLLVATAVAVAAAYDDDDGDSRSLSMDMPDLSV